MTEKKRKPPSVHAVDSLGEGHYRLMEVASILGVSESTMRRWLKDESLEAPSYQLNSGGMTTYVYTDADIEELRVHKRVTPEPELRTEARSKP